MGCWGSPGALSWDEELAQGRGQAGTGKLPRWKDKSSRVWFGHGQEQQEPHESARMSWSL